MTKNLSTLAKGTWSGATAYTIGDIVDYLSSSYICIANSTGDTPPDATYWQPLSSGIEWKGAWGAGTYTKNQAVENDGIAWIVNTTSTTEEPTGSPTDWDTLAEKGATGSTGATGDKGDTGDAGPVGEDGISAGLLYNFDTTITDSDPGSGNLRFNHAVIASVTKLFIDDLEDGGADVSSFLDSWDDSTDPNITGTVFIMKIGTPSTFAVFSITGAVTDDTGYRDVVVTHVVSNGTFSDTDPISVLFTRTGNKGADGAGAGDVTAAAVMADNAVVRGDGGSKGVQDSGVIIDNSDNVSGMLTLTLPNVGLHLLDTNASHDLIIKPGSNLTADRIFTLTTGDAARTLDISAADVTVSTFGASIIDDANAAAARTTLGLGTSDTPQFARLGIGAAADGTQLLILGATTAVSSILDEDDLATDSATALATQQSIKAYVDAIDVTSVTITEVPSSDHTATGIKVPGTAGENLVFGDACYIKSDGKMWKADADAIATSSATHLCLATIAADASGSFLLIGVARDDTWTWTVGGLIYLSLTAGAMTQTAPSATDDVIQILGKATHADRMYFKPELVQVEHV